MSNRHSHEGMHPVDVLEEEHEVILAVLEAFERKSAALETGEAPDRDFWLGAVDFIQNFADRCHHGKEEDLLFPALVRLGMPEDSGPILVMKQEHEMGRQIVRRLQSAVEAGDGRSVLEASSTYVELLREHIQKENVILFALARQILPAEQTADLLRSFEAVEKEKMGDGTHCKYIQLARRLCEEAGADFEIARGGRDLEARSIGHHAVPGKDK